MENLIKAFYLNQEYEQMGFQSLVAEFEKHTKQIVPTKALYDFKHTGLNNLDFLTSDFLNKYGIKNLLQTAMLYDEGTMQTRMHRVSMYSLLQWFYSLRLY